MQGGENNSSSSFRGIFASIFKMFRLVEVPQREVRGTFAESWRMVSDASVIGSLSLSLRACIRHVSILKFLLRFDTSCSVNLRLRLRAFIRPVRVFRSFHLLSRTCLVRQIEGIPS